MQFVAAAACSSQVERFPLLIRKILSKGTTHAYLTPQKSVPCSHNRYRIKNLPHLSSEEAAKKFAKEASSAPGIQ